VSLVKLGHSKFQIRTEGSELGQYPHPNRNGKELPKMGIVLPAASERAPGVTPGLSIRALPQR
jgi:hypothetical protein